MELQVLHMALEEWRSILIPAEREPFCPRFVFIENPMQHSHEVFLPEGLQDGLKTVAFLFCFNSCH